MRTEGCILKKVLENVDYEHWRKDVEIFHNILCCFNLKITLVNI